jgi:hippurate hydrolase
VASTGAARTILSHQDTLKDWQESLYKDFHRNPELSHHEERTSGIIAEQLTGFGFEVHSNIGGLVGVLTNGPRPTVLVRADMDALPVAEATGLDYASTAVATDDQGAQTPVMHACGHDVHMTSLMGAARLFAQERDAWAGHTGRALPARRRTW